MQIDINATGEAVLKRVYNGVLLETAEGNQMGVRMRDDTLEINVCPAGEDTGNWWRINMQKGTIERMGSESLRILKSRKK